MKTIIKTILTVNILCCLLACKKTDSPYASSGAINVTNAVIGGATLTFNSTTQTVSNNNYSWFPVASGNSVVNLNIAATATSPSIAYYNQNLTVSDADNYSLFLSGSSPSSVDATLIKETYSNYSDSLCGVRIINLAPNSNPINVNIKGNAPGSEVNNLAYKAYSNFTQHPAKKLNPSYIFEFRDAGTGNLITSYTLTTPYFHNVTLVLRGKVGGSPAPGVTLDADY